MEETNEHEDVIEVEEEEEEADEPTEPTEDPNALKARIQKLEEKAIAQRERTRLLRQELAKAKPKPEAPKEAPSQSSGELNETQLDYLELKGVTEQEDIDYIQKVVNREGISVRQALKDDMVVEKLAKNAKKREVQAATPSATRRSGQTAVNEVDLWVAKIERGEAKLGDITDFTTRAAVVEARERKQDNNRPPWQR